MILSQVQDCEGLLDGEWGRRKHVTGFPPVGVLWVNARANTDITFIFEWMDL